VFAAGRVESCMARRGHRQSVHDRGFPLQRRLEFEERLLEPDGHTVDGPNLPTSTGAFGGH